MPVAAATTDPEMGDLLAHHKSLRAQAFRTYVETIAARNLLRPRLDPADATDVLLTLVGSDTYLNFTEARGWTLQRYVTWTTNVLCTMLLDSSHANAHRRS